MYNIVERPVSPGVFFLEASLVVRIGRPATASRELRQARKGAAVAVMPGAGDWLVRAAST